MLKALLASYGVKELAFLRNASSPKLEPLGVPSLLPVEDEIEKKGEDKTAPSSPVCVGGGGVGRFKKVGRCGRIMSDGRGAP